MFHMCLLFEWASISHFSPFCLLLCLRLLTTVPVTKQMLSTCLWGIEKPHVWRKRPGSVKSAPLCARASSTWEWWGGEYRFPLSYRLTVSSTLDTLVFLFVAHVWCSGKRYKTMSVFLGRGNCPVSLLPWKAVMNHGILMDWGLCAVLAH